MQALKKILVFIDWFLPGYKAGGPIRSVANLTAHLSGEFKFFIVTRDTDYLETNPYADVEPNKWVDFAENVKVFYFSADNLSVANIKKLVNNTDFDIVYINGIYSFYFSLLPVYLFRKTRGKVVVASRGMLSEHSFSSKNLKKKIFFRFARLFKFYKNGYFHVTNEQEKNEVGSLNLKPKGFMVAPNLAAKLPGAKNIYKKKTPAVLKLISIARISVEKNTLFALQALADGEYLGDIKLDIYGSVYRQEYWNECLSVIKSLPENIKVSYKGELDNKKVNETLQNYHFSFLPSLGENFGHSILESLSAACPVIISDQTPWRNLEEKNVGWDIPLKNKDKFINTIQYCIDMDQEEYDKWSEKAYGFAKEFANKPELIEQSRKLFVT